MRWRALRQFVLTGIHFAERQAGRKIETEERSAFRRGLRGTGKAISLGNGCHEGLSLQLFIRGQMLIFRINVLPEAAQNGCLETAKRVQSELGTTLRLGSAPERKYLPIEIPICIVGHNGVVQSFEGKISLGREEGRSPGG